MGMATLTGANGALRFDGKTVAKVRQYDVSINRDSLEDTCLNTDQRTYIPGLIGATGSCTVLIDPGDDGGRMMLNTILSPAAGHSIEFIFDQKIGRSIEAAGFLTSVSPSVSVGDVQSASVSFQLSGPLRGGF